MRLSIALRLLLLLSAVLLTTNGHGQSRSPEASLDAVLRPYLSRYSLPALAAAIVNRGEIVAFGAVGTRRAGTTNPVSIEDRFHIGSDTKAMTSLLAAILVEAGQLRWATTVGQVFPELASTADRELKSVT